MNTTKKVITSPQLEEKLIAGIDILADSVGSTLGPMGKNVILETAYGATTVTKDGVTVANYIDLEDPVQNLAVQILKQAAKRTSDIAGDGTTTSTVIAHALVKEARKLINAGEPPISIKRDLETYLKHALAIIRSNAYEVDANKILEIATISANNDHDIGNLIYQAFLHVGKEGVILLDEAKDGTTSVDLVDGVFFDKGFASPFFINNPAKEECVLNNPLIFFTDYKIRHTEDIVPILEKAHAQGRPLLIVADEIDGPALQLLVLNKVHGGLKVCAVRAPSFGNRRYDLLEDFAALTSSTLVSQSAAMRLEDTPVAYLGEASKVVISKNRTIFVDPKKDLTRVEQRAEQIRQNLVNSEDSYSTKKLQERLASLTSSIAVLFVGAATETELKEKKDRIDDALRATTSAVVKGYGVGGGTMLARVAQQLKTDFPQSFTLDVFYKALTAPLKKISENAAVSGDITLSAVLSTPDFSYGYNARNNTFENLIDAGIIDPILVIEQALINAVSAATMLLLSSTAIYFSDRTPRYSPGSLDDYATSA